MCWVVYHFLKLLNMRMFELKKILKRCAKIVSQVNYVLLKRFKNYGTLNKLIYNFFVCYFYGNL